jgi:histidinol-phosphate aminotransferase
VIEAIRSLTVEDFAIYPEYGGFNENLAQYLGVNQDEVLITNGTDEAIKLVMETYLEMGDSLILPTPTFAMFEIYASIIGLNISKVLYNSDLSFPSEGVMKSITENTKMIVLVNPNNPTGSVIPEENIYEIVQEAQLKGILVVIDEAYSQYYGKSSIKLIQEYSNVVVLQTFSKAFGLAGIRLGYVVSNSQNIRTLRKVLSPYSVNRIAIVAGNAALSDLEYVQNYSKEVCQNRQDVTNELTQLGIRVYPTEANFVIADFGEKCNYIYTQLKEGNILVRNRTQYPLLKNCLRIGIGTKYQCTILLREIKFLLSQWEFFKQKDYDIPQNLILLRKRNGAWR